MADPVGDDDGSDDSDAPTDGSELVLGTPEGCKLELGDDDGS